MHIEKNIFDNIFNTVMDIKDKSKDNIKVRVDLKEIYRRKALELKDGGGEKLLKLKAPFTLTLEQRRAICERVKNLQVPDGYSFNPSRCVYIRSGRLFGLKSHDCHILMQYLLPTTFSYLQDQILKPLIELSVFFKGLCSSKLNIENLILMEQEILFIRCQLEKIFSLGFFDSMEHIPVHLLCEAIVGGPIQYRWLYSFEIHLNKLKKTAKNKARPKGSIYEAYLMYETTHFCSYYFETMSQSGRSTAPQNIGKSFNIFILSGSGEPIGISTVLYLTDREMKVITLYILLNCDEVEQYLE
ncbi:hypothetical protein MA16_Dca008877 [Dendrobium catenatum]|uniref:DUF4218 domain-containing protein n=1 Tax=Dendrobium catenatum TaxID=906689 RepID=A0A2I0VUI7_9ASPA|nr:hypothetical protein MA16_Dca008877 [Dendrobium catenatum]